MRGYWALVSARFRMLLQYRAAAVGGFGTQLFFGLILIMVYEAFYRSSSAPQPLPYADVVTYVWLGQGLLAMLPWNVDAEIRALVRSGNVAYELLRPIDLYNAWYCRALAWRTAPTLLRSVPLFVVAGLFFGLRPPASPAGAAAFLVAMLGALLLGCAITTLMNISLLWTTSDDGIALLLPAAVLVFSGMMVPLPLFPAWAQRILYLLPFRGLIDVPFRLYVGNIPPAECLPLFAQQLAWTAALVLLGRWLLERGKRRLVVQGG
ncbi:MAG TPA: ABC-2 family transporter protein [Anaerolineae bacterium]|nr:ABC-2 family transporter protein [Anaerolineae bacterium]HOQ98566.1 ABC-2 family transporter protein [Anaerolineae bacterium]HPL28423.1 ABC-2 family transporter protein [Anaerolineae bacterium]